MLSKSDLLPVLDDFQPENARRHLRELASAAPVIELSAKNKDGLDAWFHWLITQLGEREQRSETLAAVPESA